MAMEHRMARFLLPETEPDEVDSNGGFSRRTWSKEDDGWYVPKKETTADGRQAAAVNMITCVDDDAFKLHVRDFPLESDIP